MSLSRPDRSSSLTLDLELETPSPLDDSVSTLRISARILSEVAGVLTKFPFVKPLAAVVAIICEIFEVSGSGSLISTVIDSQQLCRM